MKRLNGIEKAALILAVLLVAVGIYSAIHPTAMYVSHGVTGGRGVPTSSSAEYVTRPMGRIYGFFSVAIGAGIAFVVFCGKPR